MLMSLSFRLKLLCLLLLSFTGYLEWSDQSAFFFQLEWKILTQVWTKPQDVLHPLTVLPIIAQFGMLWYLVMPEKFSSKINLKICIWTLLLLFVFVSFIAFLSLNHKMILGSLPFVICAIWVLLILRRFDRASIKH